MIYNVSAVVTAEHDLPPDAVVLVRAHWVPKTSSGKVQRHACKRNFEQDADMHVIARWSVWDESIATDDAGVDSADAGNEVSPVDDSGLSPAVVEAVIYYVKQVGKNRAKNVTMNTNIIHLGLDSLERLDIAQSLQTAFGGRIPEEVLQEVETVREVAEAIQEHIGTELVSGDLDNLETKVKKFTGPIPESYYQLDKMPEYLRLDELRKQISTTGIRNPFFSVHEGRIGDTTQINGKTLISYSSYNYLGLSGHPEVNASTQKQAIDQFGTSVSASRIVSGEKTIHRQLEKELSEFLGVEDVITFPGGHATNESVIGHLVGPGDLIIHDGFAHNSIIQGAELSGARRRPFEHNNWQELNQILTENRREYRRVLIAVEGLYSMDGDYFRVASFCRYQETPQSLAVR